jgi:hypothetical protein
VTTNVMTNSGTPRDVPVVPEPRVSYSPARPGSSVYLLIPTPDVPGADRAENDGANEDD